ncbi:MAG: CocE/NonD family hydrolase [Candidatus Latescibacterota bacterium]|nr:CocE/NonD family hydrolase [Candidatus Latescibacterota bacterium]
MDKEHYTETQTWLAMNDGVRLDASVLVPAGRAPADGWPAVLLVHGHGDTGCKASCLPRARHLAQRGYVVGAYSVRGQGASEGLTFHMGAREIFDLQDVVAWILSDCPVHSERLAVCGSSQGGWHAYMAAIHCPQVATVVPENVFTDYASFVVRDGCLNRWFFTRTMRRRIMTAGFQELTRQWALAGEWELLRTWMHERSPLNFADRIHCPVFIVHGWHDVGMPPNEVVEMYERLQVPKKLYLGAGGHDGVEHEDAKQLRESLVDRWLDHWLQGEESGILDEAPITVARRPGWDHVSLQSLTRETCRVYHLRVDGGLKDEAPDGPTVPSNINNFSTDPTYGLAQALRDDMEGVADALTREEVVFESDPLDADLSILGAPTARLHILPNRPEVQVHAEVYDVSPEGEATLISRGHQGTRTAVAGRHRVADVRLATIHHTLAAGSRLRLVVANYNSTFAYPFFVTSCTRLFHDDERPSTLTLPLA